MKISRTQNPPKPAPKAAQPESAAPAEVAPAAVEPPKVAPRPTLKRVSTAPNVTILLHPYTGKTFTAHPVDLEVLDGWTQAQLDAGKLVEC